MSLRQGEAEFNETMTTFTTQSLSRILLTSAGREWTGLDGDFVHIPRGLSHVPGSVDGRDGQPLRLLQSRHETIPFLSCPYRFV
ncbi:hypothetical protein [Neorhizobium galegae]|uniref:hypothetical protein n=1 Tax=Neorhizobium galegae TaxID=399 RepID=UPI0020361748|nr:hypothetical protein [Neorhizobium galegae]MCM2498669.1 hypothetical protein [Neorhizobium galegae]